MRVHDPPQGNPGSAIALRHVAEEFTGYYMKFKGFSPLMEDFPSIFRYGAITSITLGGGGANIHEGV